MMAPDHEVEFVDQLGNHFMLDTTFEVRVGGATGYLEENAHTSPGRMHVYFPDRGYDRTLSLSDLDWISEPARHWIAGFLAGTEPGVYQYLGIDHLDDPPDPTEQEWHRWREAMARFRRTGRLSFRPNARPTTPLEITADERAELRIVGELRPWAYAGERVWVPSGDTWVEADPQPQLVDLELAGSVCAQRGSPDMMSLASGWSICLDCAQVSPE